MILYLFISFIFFHFLLSSKAVFISTVMAAAAFRSRGLAGVRNTNVLILIFLLSLVYVTNSLMKVRTKSLLN